MSKVDVPKLNTTMVKCGSKHQHQKDICSKKIELCAQNMLEHSRFNSQEHDFKGYV